MRRQWVTFDKEASSIVMACSHCYRLSSLVEQLRCTPTTPWQLASLVTSNVRVHRDSKGGELSSVPIYPTCGLRTRWDH
eukprot:6173259-Pleurochrysis_carterae.AAC.4